MQWIDRKDQEIPFDKEVLVILKGRFGILYRDAKEGNFCAMTPYENLIITRLDEQYYERIDYWAYLPDPIFRIDQPERLNPEDRFF